MLPKVTDEDFTDWAFGHDVWVDFIMWEKGCLDLFDAWNDRHGDLHRMHEEDPIEGSLKIMEQLYQQHRNSPMDKKMHKITESMKVAAKDITKGKPSAALKVLKGAEKKNEKLVKIDKEVRDPLIEECKKHMPMKKGKK